MVIVALSQVPRLNRQTVQGFLGKLVAGEGPLDPIYDALRERIRIPTKTLAGRVFCYPAVNELPVPVAPILCLAGVQVIEVMQGITASSFFEAQRSSPRLT